MAIPAVRSLALLIIPLLLVSSLFSGTAYAEPPPPTPGATVEPTSGTVGTTFTFSFAGWTPDEEIKYWVVGPGSPRSFETGRFLNDPGSNGRMVWTWTAPRGIWSGVWTMNAEGLRSEVAIEIPFELTGEGPLVISGVRPEQGPPGTEFVFYTDAWPKGDVVDTWVLPPGSDNPFALGRIYGDPDEQGLTKWEWEAPPNVWNGTWTMNARGFWSQIQVQIPFVITDAAPPPTPPTFSVAPAEAFPGSTLTFTATGFTSGEEVTYWLNAPGVETPVDAGAIESLFANSQGEATWQWTVPLDAVPGNWSMVALGRESDVRHQIGFVVLAGEAPPPDDGAPVAQAEPSAGPPGTTFHFSATGFHFWRNELIQYWATDPEGKTFSDNQGVFVDYNRRVIFDWTSPVDALPGAWRMHIQGPQSGLVVDIDFEITGPQNPAPPPRNVSPSSGPPGTTFTFVEDGFQRSEKIGWWATAPDGTIFQGGIDDKANEAGHFEWQWTAPANAMSGLWRMIAQGKNSASPRIISFEITSSTTPPPAPTEPPRPPYQVTPTSGPPGITFTFEVEGLVPGERFGYWADAPDHSIYPGTQELNVDDAGKITWSWQAPIDALPGDWMMVAESSTSSGKEGNTRITIPFVIEPPGR